MVLNEARIWGVYFLSFQVTYLGLSLITEKLNDLGFKIQYSKAELIRVERHNTHFEGNAYPKWIDDSKAPVSSE